VVALVVAVVLLVELVVGVVEEVVVVNVGREVDVVDVVGGLVVVVETVVAGVEVVDVVGGEVEVVVPGLLRAYAPAPRTITKITTTTARVTALLIPFSDLNLRGLLLIF
jgi:hypothetical protein